MQSLDLRSGFFDDGWRTVPLPCAFVAVSLPTWRNDRKSDLRELSIMSSPGHPRPGNQVSQACGHRYDRTWRQKIADQIGPEQDRGLFWLTKALTRKPRASDRRRIDAGGSELRTELGSSCAGRLVTGDAFVVGG